MTTKHPPKQTSKQSKKHSAAPVRLVRELFESDSKLLLIGFVCVAVAILVINTVYITTRTRNTTVNAPDTKLATRYVLTSQDTAQTPEYTIRIQNVYQDPSEDKAFPMKDGETMLIFTLSVTNNTAATQDFYPANQLFVRDQEGGTYPPHASSKLSNPIPANPLLPGDTVSGQISFAVPARLAKPLVYIDLGWSHAVPVVYDVLR